MIDTWEKVLDPNFINAELIGDVGAERVVTIKDIDFKEAYDQRSNSKSMKQSLFFEECKPMVLNKTNTKTLIRLFGADGSNPQACVGKKIVLYVDKTKVAGKPTTGIRIREYTEIKCDECGEVIKPTSTKNVSELVEISKRNTGRKLCLKCMKKEKERMEIQGSENG
ncbi:MAG: hypothetical protein HFI75_08710 [Lachnospiraceae bacterium]|nr:hypothetical protein [Lachnospiraceae bacterium]